MSIVIPGQTITSEQGYLRGHGSYLVENGDGSELVSALAGKIERVNKLIIVKSLKSRYIGEVGDLVVGRISSVEAKRWKVDIHSQKDANLLLSSVNLPGGVQRMRTHEDQMQMRSLYTENDLISAEIQMISADGVIALHTRSLRYGKLENGQFVSVPSSLVKRLPQHYVSMNWGVDILLGRNGYVWVSRTMPEDWKLLEGGLNQQEDSAAPMDPDVLQRLRHRHATTPISPEERLNIARTCNALMILSLERITVSPESIAHIYQLSVDLSIAPKDMTKQDNVNILIKSLTNE